MKFLLLNQTFHPDVVATAQYLTVVARALVERGHHVSVITSRRAYDHPDIIFPERESWNGIDIQRVRGTRFGKKSRLRRAADFATFILACSWQLLRAPRPDVVVALTSPPLISVIAACYAACRRCRFVYWVMDLNPDEAIAAGWLQKSSMTARMLNALSEFSLHRADAVIALDRFMERRIIDKGISPKKVFVIPPWSHDETVRFDLAGREGFRREHGLAGKFVVMYSGNHSPCHPLDSLLSAVEQLRGDATVHFCFVGGGSGFAKVQQFAAERNSANVLCLPYQPLERLAASLSAADLHVVVMGENFVGTIHPCKIYNVMRVAPAVLYIGPQTSHVTDIFRDSASPSFVATQNGEVDAIARAIRQLRPAPLQPSEFISLAGPFSQTRLLPRLIAIFESWGNASAEERDGISLSPPRGEGRE
ncbi:MAG TPA: glycosyltransferase family 4 protein [Methylomirabilota bacterium]|nr:glycosyltransferase family 4 protein [Methylomirabilota bacterium]